MSAQPIQSTPDDILNGQVIYLKRGRLNKFGFEPAWNAYFDFYLSSKYLEKPILQLEDVTFHLWLRKNLNDDDPNWQMPSIRIIKRKFGISQDKIEAMFNRLEKARLLKKVSGQGSGDKGANITNTYELSDPIQDLPDFFTVAREGKFSQPLKIEWQRQPSPVPEIGTGALPKIGTPPVPEIGTHKHTSSIKQTTRAKLKNNNNTGGEQKSVVVAALVQKGVSPKVANRLASRHKEARIYEKIEHLEYRLENEKIKNPGGMLVKMLEEDWTAPAGFKSKSELEKAATEQKQRQEDQQRLLEEQRQSEAAEQAAKEEERAKLRQTVLDTHATAKDLVDLWEQNLLPRLQSPWLQGSLLLRLEETTATLWLPNAFMRDQVERQFLKDIYKILARHLKVHFSEITVELVCPEEVQPT